MSPGLYKSNYVFVFTTTLFLRRKRKEPNTFMKLLKYYKKSHYKLMNLFLKQCPLVYKNKNLFSTTLFLSENRMHKKPLEIY